jgi:hypothetical protein
MSTVEKEAENLDALFSGRNPSKGSRGLTSDTGLKIEQNIPIGCFLH